MVVAASALPDVARADLAAHRRPTADPSAADGPFSFGSSGVALRVAPTLGLVLLASALLHVGIISGFTFLSLRIEALGGSPGVSPSRPACRPGRRCRPCWSWAPLAARVGLRAIFTVSALLYAGCLVSWTSSTCPWRSWPAGS